MGEGGGGTKKGLQLANVSPVGRTVYELASNQITKNYNICTLRLLAFFINGAFIEEEIQETNMLPPYLKDNRDCGQGGR